MIDVVKGMPDDKRLELYEDRFMALANAVATTIRGQEYIVSQLPPLSDDRPHTEHLRRQDTLRALDRSMTQIYTYFIGD